MASAGQQVTLTVAKQGAVYHGLAMLICEEVPQPLPAAARQVEGPAGPISMYDHQRMLSGDGAGHDMRSRPLNQQMEAVSTPALGGLKKEPAARDIAVSPVASSLANVYVASRLDSSRAASTSHLDAVQLRQPASNQRLADQRQSESAISRLAPKMAALNPQLGSSSATELRPVSDSANNQRVLEWQMRNQMAKGNESLGQVPRRFENESNPTVVANSEQKPNYYSAGPQSHLVEPGYVMPGSTKAASPLPQTTSMPVVADKVTGNRGHTPVYSDDQRYKPQQLQPSVCDHQSTMSGPPQFNQVPNVRPQMPETVRQPLPGMVAQEVYHPGPNRQSNLPGIYQPAAVFGKSMQYRSPGASSPTVTASSEQKPSYYSARPQSQLIEPGYVVSGSAKTVSPLPQSTSMPVITDTVTINHGHALVSLGQQSAAATLSYSVNTPVCSDDPRYKPQQLQPIVYDQQSTMSFPSHFNQAANVRPEMVRQPLPGMVAQGVQHPGLNVRSNLPSVQQQPPVTGNAIQYRPPDGQYGVHGTTGNMGMTPPGVQYNLANASGRIPAVGTADGMPVHSDGVHYVGPDIYDRRSMPQDVREVANVENRAVPAGIAFSTDSRPHTAYEGLHGEPHIDKSRPADARYGMSNVAGVMPSMRPVLPNVDVERKLPQAGIRYGMPNVGGHMPPAPPNIRYASLSSEDRLLEPAGSVEASRDLSSAKFSQQVGYYESPNTAVSYSSQEAPYRIYSTAGSTSVVPSNIRYVAGYQSNTADHWPSPPAQNDYYWAPNVLNEFSVLPSVGAQPQSGLVSVPQIQSTGDSSKPLPSDVRPRVQSVVTPMPHLPPGMPTNDVRPKKQPPPIAAKPKFSVSAGAAMKPKEITKEEGKQLKPEKMQQKLLEIQRLESRPYLTANEQTKLRNLRVEVEFDKRLADLNEKREDSSDLEQSRMFPPVLAATAVGQSSHAAPQQTTVTSTYRPSVEIQQHQASQPSVYVPTTLRYSDHPPAVAVDRSGERWMSEPSNPPSVTTVSDVPGNDQIKHLQSWETGRMMPVQSTMSPASAELEMVPSTAVIYAPYQTSNAEQRSGSLAPYSAVSQMEAWKQSGSAYDASYRQAGNSDMQVMPAEYYENRLNVDIGENVGEGHRVTAANLEMSSAVRGASSSALRQPASTPGSSKKTVTFHENIATEYAIHHSYGSTSSDSSFIALSPPDTSGGYDSVMFPGPVNSYGSPLPR